MDVNPEADPREEDNKDTWDIDLDQVIFKQSLELKCGIDAGE